ncbi:MAG: helix-turn-helix domain-containing protein [Clostridia bacterium]|nr:helix-turn-helix domain-containing protein [Deltaproteobacteria bacterium]
MVANASGDGSSSVQKFHPVVINGQKFAASLLQAVGSSELSTVRNGGDVLLTVREVAERLRICTATVYKL